MDLLVTLLSEVFGAKVALEGLDVFVDKKVVFQAAFPWELFATTFEFAEQ